MVKLFELLQQKLELFRLEQRYTKRRHRRSTFVSDATYVDGEYVYTNPPSLNTTGSSNTSNSSSWNSATPKIPSKRHSIVDFRSVPSQEDEHASMSVATENEEQRPKGGSWGRWNAGRARNKRASIMVVREVPTWEEEDSRR